jgi:hypothetical protein
MKTGKDTILATQAHCVSGVAAATMRNCVADAEMFAGASRRFQGTATNRLALESQR